MATATSIEPVRPEDIEELSQFLVAGFGLSPDSEICSPEVLHWKYFDPCGLDALPRGLVARDQGRLVGFVGVCPSRFLVLGQHSLEPVATGHTIDWLAAPSHPAIGGSLMRRVLSELPSAFGIGGSDVGQKVARILGLQRVSEVPVFTKLFRPLYQFRLPGMGWRQRYWGAAKDLVKFLLDRGRRPTDAVELQQLKAFGTEIEEIMQRWQGPLVCTSRAPELLNHMLRYPGQYFTGWLLRREHRVIGFALLGVIPNGNVRQGKIVDCFLDTADEECWHAAVSSLAKELGRQLADYVVGFASTPWMVAAMRGCGFRLGRAMNFNLFDRQHRVPRDLPFHLSQLEGDHAYR